MQNLCIILIKKNHTTYLKRNSKENTNYFEMRLHSDRSTANSTQSERKATAKRVKLERSMHEESTHTILFLVKHQTSNQEHQMGATN